MRKGMKWAIAAMFLTLLGMIIVPAVYGWFHMM